MYLDDVFTFLVTGLSGRKVFLIQQRSAFQFLLIASWFLLIRVQRGTFSVLDKTLILSPWMHKPTSVNSHWNGYVFFQMPVQCEHPKSYRFSAYFFFYYGRARAHIQKKTKESSTRRLAEIHSWLEASGFIDSLFLHFLLSLTLTNVVPSFVENHCRFK